MNKFTKIALGFGVFVAVAFALGYASTSGVAEQGESLLSALRGEGTRTVDSFLSEKFKQNVKPETFKGIVQRFGLNKIESTWWNQRSVENSVGTLRGKVTIEDGREIPLHLGFTKDNGEWKLSEIVVEPPGRVEDISTLTVPNNEALVELSKSSMSSFAKALESHDFEMFYQEISENWKLSSTPKMFLKNFAPLIEKNYDFGLLNTHTPELTKTAEIAESGFLNVYGHFPTAGEKNVEYRFSYVNEFGKWKLTGLSVIPVIEKNSVQ